ncbi:hypothetical protein BKI52_34635 [marine bacterium AO1-C]|nr:hypothetical protein BKI52_34635 [marine bacterium AO1-C]
MGKERKRDLSKEEQLLIEDFFNDKLNPQEVQEFEEKMKEPWFAEWVDKYRQAALWIDSLAEAELLKDLNMDIEAFDEEEIKKAFGEYPLLLKKIQQLMKQKGEDNDEKK